MGDLGLNKVTLKRKLGIVTSGEAVGTNQAQTFLKVQTFASGFVLTGDISPPVISADQNNYNPAGLADATNLRLATNDATTRNITGLASQGDDRFIVVHNVGPGHIILQDESGSSTAANRFAANAAFDLGPDQSLILQYDSIAQRWRIASGETGPPTGAAGGDLTGFYPDPQILAGAIIDSDINASGITTRSKLPALLAYEDEANVFTLANTFQETVTINKNAQAGVAEAIQTWKVSDDGGGAITMANAGTTDGEFRPLLKFWDARATSATVGNFIIAQCLDTQDIGGVPILEIRSQLPAAPSVNRAVLRISNFADVLLTLNPKGDIVQTRIAQAGIGEVLHKWQVSDVTAGQGYLQIENDSATDAQFTPMIEALQGQTANNPALIIKAIHGNDAVATNPAMVLDSRLSGDVTLTVRPLLSIRNNASDRLQVRADGGINQTVIDAGGNPELYKAQISGNATAYFKILDADPSTTRFGPWLFAFNDNTSAFPALHVYAQIVAAGDTGTTQPIMVLDSRTSTGAATVRPLLMLRAFGTEYWRSNPSGQIVQTVISQATVAELIHKWQVSDDATSYLELKNASTTDGQFAPWLFSSNLFASAVHPGLYLYSAIATAQDSGGVPLMIFDSRLASNAAPTIRPVFDFRAGGVSRLLIGPDGKITHNIASSAGVAEVFYRWNLSDDANSLVQLENTTAADGIFQPMFRMRNGSNTGGSYFLIDTLAAQDVTTNPMLSILIRRSDATAITTRNLLNISNAGTAVLDILVTGSQLITSSAQDSMILYRSTNTIGNRDALRFDMQRLDGTRTTYGFLLFEIADNTDTLEDSIFRIFVRKDGVSVNPLTLTQNGTLTQTARAISGQEILHQWSVSDNAISYLQLTNVYVSDTNYGTQFIFRGLEPNSGAQNYFTCIVDNLQDTGNSPVTIFRSYDDLNVPLDNRPLLGIYNFTTQCVLFMPKGDMLQTIAAQAGVSEICHKWQLSENQISFIEILNTTATDGKFSPGILMRHDFDNVSACGSIIAEVGSTFDSGSSSVLTFISRRVGGANITTRPPVKFLNNVTTYCTINPNGDFLHNIMAQTGGAETLHVWTVSDSAGYIKFTNSLSTDAVFVPQFLTYNATGGSGSFGFRTEHYIPVLDDAGTNPMYVIDVRLFNDTALLVKPLFDIRNANVSKLLMNFDGKITYTITGQAGVAETLCKWQISDDANSVINFENASATDAQFVPQIRLYSARASNLDGSIIRGQIISTQDTGTSPTLIIMSQLSTGVAIVTRPVIAFRNATTLLMQLNAASLELADAIDFKVGATTGSKIGTATTQKLAFWNATPIVQPAANPDTTGATLAALETEVNELKALLRNVGLMAP